MEIKQRNVSRFRPKPWDTKDYFLIPLLKDTHCLLIYMEDYDVPDRNYPSLKTYMILPKHSVNLNDIFFNESDLSFYEAKTPLTQSLSLTTDVLFNEQSELRYILNHFYISEGTKSSWSKAFSIVAEEHSPYPYFHLRDIPLI